VNYFCTLFDSFYLSRGLAMYESLISHSKEFHLYIFAFDDLAAGILQKLQLDKVTVIPLKDFETDGLKEVKKERSRAEYCWTCTPSTIYYVIKNYEISHCTYIDADLIFYSDPAILVSEIEENMKSILITGHRYSMLPKIYEEKRAGRFCVQFITFLNNEKSLQVLERWRDQCIDWCFARHEEGKFGDQKYLDEWPDKYPDLIHIMKNDGGGIAPWNLQKYSFRIKGDTLYGRVKKNGSDFKVVFFHFQYVKYFDNGSVDLGWYIIPPIVKKLFYLPYLSRIDEIENKLLTIDMNYKKGFTNFKVDSLWTIIKSGIKKVFGYNIIIGS
jgi:hypothetical protein